MRKERPVRQETVEAILDRLEKKRGEKIPGSLARLVCGQLCRAYRDFENLPQLTHLQDVRDAAESASKAIGQLIKVLRGAGLLAGPFRFESNLTRARRVTDLWRNVWPWPKEPRKDMKQYIAALCAIRIIETCSDDKPVKTSRGNVHVIAQRVYLEIFRHQPEDKDHWLLSTCREVIKQRQTYKKYLDWLKDPESSIEDKNRPMKPEWPSGIQFFPPKRRHR